MKLCHLKLPKHQKELEIKLANEEHEEILGKNDEINPKHLQQRKKMFTYLMFKPTRPISASTGFEQES